MKKSLKICVLSLMSSFVFVSAYIKIDIPLGPSTTMIGFSNVFCLLSGLVMDPIYAGICSAVGSTVFDLTSPRYIASAPFTFISKFLLAYVCGKVFRKFKKNSSINSSIVATVLGSITFLVFRIVKVFLHNQIALSLGFWPNIILTSKNALSTVINLVIGILCAILLEPMFKKALLKANLEGVFK